MNTDRMIHDRAAGEPGTYILRATMELPRPRAEVFAFFSDARNLEHDILKRGNVLLAQIIGKK